MGKTEILVSIDDEKAKYISEVISNKSCMKILDYLSENENTVSDVSKDLKIPINTADYNIKKLLKSGLIEKKSYWWSTKGKKMPTYTVANKKIVISPKKRKIGYSKYLFALVATGIGAIILRAFNLNDKSALMSTGPLEKTNELVNTPVVSDAARESVIESTKSGAVYAADAAGEVAVGSAEIVTRSGDIIVSGYLGMDVWLWFLIGAWFSIFLFFLFNMFSERGFKNK